MGSFKNNALTDAGRVLLGDVQMGAVFTPTKLVIGSGQLPPGETPRTLKQVVSPVIELAPNKKRRANDGTFVVGGLYTNEKIKEDFYFRELALYAKAVWQDGRESTEVLYSYGNAGDLADFMPSYSSGTPVERQIDLSVYIGNDAKVDLTIASGMYVSIQEKGAAGGVATLDDAGKVPEEQLPALNFVPIAEKGEPNGVASLDAAGRVPTEQMPETFDTIMEKYGYSFQTIREPELNKKTITITPGAGYKGTASLVAVFEKDERGNTVVNVTETIGGKATKHKHTVGGGAGKGEVVNG